MAEDSGDKRLTLQRNFILALALAVTAVFAWMVRDFLGAVFLAAVLTIILWPLQVRLTGLFRGRSRIAAGLVLALTLLILLVPVPILAGVIAAEAAEVTANLGPWARELVDNIRLQGWDALPDWLPREALEQYHGQITAQLGELASSAGSIIMSGLARIGGSTLMLFLNLIVLLFALYFFLTAGPKASGRALGFMPLPQKDRDLLARRALSTIRAVVKGTFLIGLLQGAVTGFALAVAGVPGAAFWGLIAGLLSIIPGVGTPLVWGPAAVWLFATGETAPAIGLAVFGFVVIMNIDNLLRPRLVGRDAKLNDLMVLISTLGGIALFGAAGIIIGPVIAALMSSVWFLYARSYAPLLAEETAAEPGGKPAPSRRKSRPSS